MTKKEIKNAIEVLQNVQYIWADQVPNEGQMIADYDAITQTIKCLEEYENEVNH